MAEENNIAVNNVEGNDNMNGGENHVNNNQFWSIRDVGKDLRAKPRYKLLTALGKPRMVCDLMRLKLSSSTESHL